MDHRREQRLDREFNLLPLLAGRRIGWHYEQGNISGFLAGRSGLCWQCKICRRLSSYVPGHQGIFLLLFFNYYSVLSGYLQFCCFVKAEL